MTTVREHFQQMRPGLARYGIGGGLGGDDFRRFAMYVDGFHDGFFAVSEVERPPLPVLFGFREWLVLRDGGATNVVWWSLMTKQAKRVLDNDHDDLDLVNYALDRLDEFLERHESGTRVEIFEAYESLLERERQRYQ